MFRKYIYTLLDMMVLLGLTLKETSCEERAHLLPPKPYRSEGDLRQLMINSYIGTTNYIPPSQSSLDTAQALFERLLITRQFSSQDEKSWSALNLMIQRARDEKGQEYAVISEPNPLEGVGHAFYAVKLGNISSSTRSKFLHAPHRPSDLYTYEIVYDLLTQNNVFGAAAWSTTHRDNVDLCKEPNSYYNSMTIAMANAVSNPLILQLHGFTKTSYPTNVDVVFSSTKTEMPQDFLPIADCVKTQIGSWTLLRYPEEVDFLGGTLNINSKLFYQENPNAKFVHFETSRELRDDLRINSELKLRISQCFGF